MLAKGAPGGMSRQGFSCHDIDHVNQEYSSLSSIKVGNKCRLYVICYYLSHWWCMCWFTNLTGSQVQGPILLKVVHCNSISIENSLYSCPHSNKMGTILCLEHMGINAITPKCYMLQIKTLEWSIIIEMHPWYFLHIKDLIWAITLYTNVLVQALSS